MSTIAPLPELRIESEDDVLEKSARTIKVQRVQRTGVANTARQSHQARAWTQSGNVD